MNGGTPYEKQVKAEQEAKNMQEKVNRIRLKLKEIPPCKDIVQLSEKVLPFLHACGCEEKMLLLDISENSLKLHTRVPMDYLIHPGKPHHPTENPQLHQYAMRRLKESSFVTSVKWIPHPDGSNILILTDFNSSK